VELSGTEPSLLFTQEPKPEFDTLEKLTALFDRANVAPELPPPERLVTMEPDVKRALFRQRADYMSSGRIVMTPQVISLIAVVEETIFGNRQSEIRDPVLLLGPTTLGKTTAVLAAAAHIEHSYRQSFPDYRHQGSFPVLVIDVPPNPTGRSVVARMADFLGIPAGTTRETMASLETTVVDTLNASGTELVIIDDLQRLARNTTGNAESVALLRNLMHRITATFLFAGFEPDRYPLVRGHAGEQILRRANMAYVSPFTTANDAEWRTWNGIVRAFEQQLGLYNHHAGDLAADYAWLHDRTEGRIHELSRVLRRASRRLLWRGVPPEEEKITRKFLEKEFPMTDLTRI
jgi:hypothetical protein